MLVISFAPFEKIVGEEDIYYSRDTNYNAVLLVNVTNEDLSPADSVNVSISRWRYPFPTTKVTDNDGQVSFNLGPGDWGLVCIAVENHDQYIYSSLYVEPDGMYYYDVTLGATAIGLNSLTGTVVNKTSGLAIPGIEVSFFGRDRVKNRIENVTTTDSLGRYQFFFTEYSYEFGISIQNESYQWFSRSFNSFLGMKNYSINATLKPNMIFKNNVTISYFEEDTGSTIIDSTEISYIGIDNSNDHEKINRYALYLSPDLDGYYHLSDLNPGDYYFDREVRIGEVDLTTRQFLFFNGTSQDIRIPVKIENNFANIEINVRNATSPLENARLIYEEYGGGIASNKYYYYKRTDENGRKNVTLLENTISELTISLSGYQEKIIQLLPSDDTTSRTVILEKVDSTSSTIYGRINVTTIDKASGIGIPSSIKIYKNPEYYISCYPGDSGQFQGTLEAGFYPFLHASNGLCSVVLYNITINEGENPDLIIYMDRRISYTDYYQVKLVDEYGVHANSFHFIVSVPGSSTDYYTNDEGYLFFSARQGVTEIRGQDPYRKDYKFLNKLMLLNGSGGVLPDLDVYKASPLFEISGFVRDSHTNNIITGVSINIDSFKLITGYSELKSPLDGQNPWLFSQDSGSNTTGYYRTWGRSDVFIYVEREGYYPLYQKLDVYSSLKNIHDIFLDPLPSNYFHINGTIVDDFDNPINAYIFAKEDNYPDINMNMQNTNDVGHFSLYLFSGNFTLHFGNSTLSETYQLEVTGPLNDLVLRLRSGSRIDITVKDWSGEKISNIEVIIEKKSGQEYWIILRETTDSFGNVSFILMEGTYRIKIPMDQNNNEFVSDYFEIIRKNDIHQTITLLNRSVGDLYGKVNGIEDPYSNGIPNARVSIFNGSTLIINEMLTNENGRFKVANLSYGQYNISIEPPDDLQYVNGTKSGYLSAHYYLDLKSTMESIEVNLEYKIHDYMNISDYSPKGINTPLDQPILISFSNKLNRYTVDNNIEIEPTLEDQVITYSDNDYTIQIDHSGFMPETEYQVWIDPEIQSTEGFHLWNYTQFEWTFTSAPIDFQWKLYSTNITVDMNKNVTIMVEAEAKIDLFIVIDGIGSYIVPEVSEGNFLTQLNGSIFDWNTEYDYYFTDVMDGMVIDINYSGLFKTPKEPSIKWHIESVSIIVDEEKNWQVDVKGNPVLDIYIVISGIDSFIIGEDTPGNYSKLIEGTNFEWDTEYEYHFSDTYGGNIPSGYDKFSGKERMPKEKENINDNNWLSTGLVILGVICILMILIAILFIVKKKSTIPNNIEE